MTTTEALTSHEGSVLHDLMIGEVVDGRFKIESILGEGGYGVVYRAVQESTGQLVALKILRVDRIKAEDKNEIARFEREMKLIGKLHHPNVVRLIDFGSLEDGRLFTVIEYIEGINLADLLENEGALRPSEAKNLMTQVLEALGAAHSMGIVYRDLKPQNIMVTTSGLRRNVKLLDFGISGLMEDARDDDYQNLTQNGKINGTPSYMAPEQLRSEPPTCQTDIYAWGLVFMEILLGYQAVSDDSYVGVLAKQISDEPVEIPQELLHQPLGQILRHAVSKPLETRYTTVEEVLLDLEDCIVPPQMVLPWTGTSARKSIEESLSVRRQRGRTPNNMVSSSSWSDSITLASPTVHYSGQHSGQFSGQHSGQFSGQHSGPVAAPPQKSNRGLLIALMLLLGVGIAIGGALLMQGGKTPPTTPENALATTDKTPQKPQPPHTEPQKPSPLALETYNVSVQATPSEAEILLDGSLRAKGGFATQLDKDGEDHTLEIRAAGYKSRSFTFNDAPPPSKVELKPLDSLQAKTPPTEARPTRSAIKWKPRPPKQTKKINSTKPATTVAETPEPKAQQAPEPSKKAPSAPKKEWNIQNSDLENPWK